MNLNKSLLISTSINKYLLISVSILVFFILVLPRGFAAAATYYVSTTGSDTTGIGSSGNPWATFSKGISSMSGGDTLIAKSGTYTGTSNSIVNVPSGTPGAYTEVRAETDWGVTLSATGSGAYTHPIDISTSYIQLRGFKIINHTGTHCVASGDYIKVIRCASDGIGGGPGASFVADGNYILFEECYAWGGGRYPIRTAKESAQYVIFRRCVVRWDYSDTKEPYACFANYECSNVYFQNCIAIDGVDNRAQEITYDGLKGFFTPNGVSETHFEGCISLNMEGAGFYIDNPPVINITLTNCVAWASKNHANAETDGYPPRAFFTRPGDGPLTLNHCTFGGSDWTQNGVSTSELTQDTIKNSILANFTALDASAYAESGFDTSDYNDYYGNAGGRDRSGGIGAHSLTTNPFTNSLKYLTRIKSGSTLSGIADDGGDIGTTILKNVGVSGTLYGELGWNETTTEDLWPFPNEDVMKQDMASFYEAPNEAYNGSPEMNGARGFAAPGNGLYGGPITLTSYIWEYLGNPCPSDICNYNITFHPADLNQNNKIEMKELMAFIGKWKSGQASFSDVLSILDRWLKGI